MLKKASVRIYLDTCVYDRPFDDQSQPRVWLETLAFSVILQMVEDREVTLITSAVLGYENSLHPDPVIRSWVQRCALLAEENRFVDDRVRQRAEALEHEGLRALDALHIACAEAVDCDYFITCDDRLIKRYGHRKRALHICTPTEFVALQSGGEK
jgi:predicted nucleic acid-binding protein